jgi:high affinity Mn2+ porin
VQRFSLLPSPFGQAMRSLACVTIAVRLGLAVLWAGSLLAPIRSTPAQELEILRLPPSTATYPPNNTGDNNTAQNNQADDTSPARDGPADDNDDDATNLWSIHGQSTIITDRHGPFRSPYIGPHSLLPIYEVPTSQTSTLFMGRRLWQDAQIYFNPEVAGGTGFSHVNGIAGFPNAEITRVGKPQPTPYIARLYVAQVFNLGGEQEKVLDSANEIAGYRDISRLTVRVGKIAASDDIDDNFYSHDGRTQFWNWALVWNGAWDYPADVRGYTWGGFIDFNQKDWALRYGLFAEPKVANGADLDPRFSQAHGQIIELENRFQFLDRPGIVRSMAYLNRADMGSYAEATNDPAVHLDITLTRRYSYKYGFGISWQQELTDDLGLLLRAGWSDGHNETWAFTPIDRTIALALVRKGTRWERPQDTVGLATVFNGLAGVHRNYLAAGGLDFNIGDGQLNYGWENIYETYYRYQIKKSIWVQGDLQYVVNPAYNRDRGPVFIQGIGVHAEF